MQKLFQTINYQYRKPVNFDEKNPEFDIFKNVSSETCWQPKIKFLSKVRIATNSVVFKYFEIFRDSCISEVNYNNYRKGYKFFLKFIFPKLNFSKKRFLLITDEWTSNYYHWHIFALVKLLALKQQNLLENSLLFLPKKYARYKFALPSLEKLGVKKNQIVFLRRKSNIKVKELAYAETYQQHPIAFNNLRQALTTNIKTDFGFGDKIYISRAGQVLRFVENENEMVALLEKYGFKKIIIDQFSYEDQIAICSKIKYLVSSHGAGLTNILFMSEGTKMLEMATKPHEEKPVTDYYKLADMLGIKYFYQECAIGENSRVKDFHQASLVVDLEKLEKNLQLMLNNE
ncbi:MAG: glycosyltransferase family 61 protein [Proteobacteria bacterium]|nr:glycosyltransferase family 61 protein [Pseudomonadota bacterium]